MDQCAAVRALRELKRVDTLVYEQSRDAFVPTLPIDRGMWQNWVKNMRAMMRSIETGLRIVDAYSKGDRVTGEPAGEGQAGEGWKPGYTGPGR